MVSKDSPYKTHRPTWSKAWKADPKMAVGGGSIPGGPDHLLPMQLAQAVGIDPKTVNFVSYDGGGDLLPAILGNKIDFATSGTGEYLDQIKSGDGARAGDHGARSGSTRCRTCRRSRSRASTWCSPTGAASWPLRASATPTRPGWIDVIDKMHDSQAVEGGAGGQERLDRRLPHR